MTLETDLKTSLEWGKKVKGEHGGIPEKTGVLGLTEKTVYVVYNNEETSFRRSPTGRTLFQVRGSRGVTSADGVVERSE